MSIQKYIQVETAYTRSINLERDSQQDSFDSSYIPTSRALRTLSSISARLTEDDQPRAWSLIGPYGSGKSSFALFLSELLASPNSEKAKAARSLLKKHDQELERVYRAETDGTDGYLEVLISGTPERLSMRYLSGLHQALVGYWSGRKDKKPKVLTLMQECIDKGEVSVSQLLKFTKLTQDALKGVGCPGILIIFDEFGKFLEYESRFLGVNDVFLLQTLAEHAHSAHETRLLIFVLLHQSIEQYARGVGESLKNEWAKIQGRFEEVPFLETAEQTLRVVSAAIQQRDIDAKAQTKIDKEVSKAVGILQEEGVLPSSLAKAEACELFAGVYPLHPTSAMLLPQLCQLISQNERTLFSYLGSREQSGFRDMLSSLENLGEFIRPDHIFDYFLANQPSVNGDFLTQRRWAESVSVIERIPNITENQASILKAIGLVNLLGNRGGIKASEGFLSSVYGKNVGDDLAMLGQMSAIVHRKFNNEYRVWQGSDFDLEARLQEQLNQLGPFSLAEEVSNSQALSPVVARKYSIEKGALRYFTLKFVDALNFSEVKATLTPQIFIFLASGQDDESLYKSEARGHLTEFGLVAYSQGGQALRTIVAERLALEAIERSAKELSEDPVAKKEFDTRLATIRQAERRHVTQIISNPENSSWYYKREELAVRDRREFQEQLSFVLEDMYPYAPEVHNELINRDKPSSQAVAARNKLMSLMISDAVKEPDLGIEQKKFPPEKAIYRALLKETGIHQKTEKDWELKAPSRKRSLYAAWKLVEEFLGTTEFQAKPFTEINAQLLSPPYGVKAGILPILWLAVYLVNEKELALYEERRYIPGFTVESLERFVKRPDLFTLQRFRIEGMRASIFKQYKEIVRGKEPESVLDIAKPLADFMGGLPEFTLKTKVGLSKKAIAVRDAFNLAKSPDKLIFEGLPKALGFSELSQTNEKDLEGFSEALTDVLRELKNAHSKLQDSLKERIAGSLGLDSSVGLEQMRIQSCGRCHGLENYTLDAQGVRGLLLRINRTEGEDSEWLENILMFLGSKPSTKWTDADRDEAEYKLTELSRRLTDLFKLAAEERKFAEQSDQNFDVYLLKSLKKGDDFIDEVITVDKNRESHSDALKKELESILDKSDKDLQLVALARVVDDFLRSRKRGQSKYEDQPELKVIDQDKGEQA